LQKAGAQAPFRPVAPFAGGLPGHRAPGAQADQVGLDDASGRQGNGLERVDIPTLAPVLADGLRARFDQLPIGGAPAV
jgi:hypothetical protein